MSGQYYVVPNENEGGQWRFTREQLARPVSEIRPGATVGGPYEGGSMNRDGNTYQIDIPSGETWTHEVIYQDNPDGFSFRTGNEEDLDATAGLVFQVIQRLAPHVPAVWVASFDGAVYPLRVEGRIPGEFVRELLSL